MCNPRWLCSNGGAFGGCCTPGCISHLPNAAPGGCAGMGCFVFAFVSCCSAFPLAVSFGLVLCCRAGWFHTNKLKARAMKCMFHTVEQQLSRLFKAFFCFTVDQFYFYWPFSEFNSRHVQLLLFLVTFTSWKWQMIDTTFPNTWKLLRIFEARHVSGCIFSSWLSFSSVIFCPNSA